MPSKKTKQWLTPEQMSKLPVGWPAGTPYTPGSKIKPALAGSKKKTRNKVRDSQKASISPHTIVNEFSKICNTSKNPQIACRKLEAMDYTSHPAVIWQTLITGSFLDIASRPVTDGVEMLRMSIFNDVSKDLRDALDLITHIVHRHKQLIVPMYDVINTIVHTSCAECQDNSEKTISLLVHMRKNFSISLSHLVAHLSEQHHLVDSGFAICFTSSVLKGISKDSSRHNAIEALQDSGLKRLIDLVPGSAKTYKKLLDNLRKNDIIFVEKAVSSLTRENQLEKVDNELYSEFSDFSSLDVLEGRIGRVFDDYVLSRRERIDCLVPHILDTDKAVAKENIRAVAKFLIKICNDSTLETYLLSSIAEQNPAGFLDICYTLYDNDVLSEDVILDWYNSDSAKEDHTEAVAELEKLAVFLVEAETESDSE